MPIKRYRKDPRSAAQKDSDARLLRAFERGEVLHVARADRQRAIETARRRLGVECGVIRIGRPLPFLTRRGTEARVVDPALAVFGSPMDCLET